MRHRAVLHSAFGIYITERVFGTFITLGNGRVVQVRDIAEQHVIDDMGTIPTLEDYLRGMPFYDWLGGPKRAAARTIQLDAGDGGIAALQRMASDIAD